MKLLILEKDAGTVAAMTEVNDGKESCPVLEYLMSVPVNQQASAKGFFDLFGRYAAGGRDGKRGGVTSKQMHHADNDEGILEFIKGQLRVFCFEDDGALVILTNVGKKKSGKAYKKDVKAAVSARDQYLEAKKAGNVEFVEVEDDEDDEDD